MVATEQSSACWQWNLTSLSRFKTVLSSHNRTKQTKTTQQKNRQRLLCRLSKGGLSQQSWHFLFSDKKNIYKEGDVKPPDPKDQLENWYSGTEVTRLSPGRKPMLKRNVISNEAADPKQTAIWLLYSTSNVRILFMAPPCHECDQNLSILSLVRLLWWSCRSTSGRKASAHLLNASQTCHCHAHPKWNLAQDRIRHSFTIEDIKNLANLYLHLPYVALDKTSSFCNTAVTHESPTVILPWLWW